MVISSLLTMKLIIASAKAATLTLIETLPYHVGAFTLGGITVSKLFGN
jgi:hypothetical protein